MRDGFRKDVRDALVGAGYRVSYARNAGDKKTGFNPKHIRVTVQVSDLSAGNLDEAFAQHKGIAEIVERIEPDSWLHVEYAQAQQAQKDCLHEQSTPSRILNSLDGRN